MRFKPFSKLRPRSVYDVMAAIACFGVLAGGTAYAANTIGSTDIIDGQVKSADVGDNEIKSADVKDESLTTFDVSTFLGADIVDGTVTGADVDESSLGTVPSSVLGGLGRPGLRQNGQAGPGSCNPETSTVVNCDIAATISLLRPARVFVIGTVRANLEGGATGGAGACQLGSTGGVIPGTTRSALFSDNSDEINERMTLVGLTGVFPAGQHAFGIDCNDTANITYRSVASNTERPAFRRTLPRARRLGGVTRASTPLPKNSKR